MQGVKASVVPFLLRQAQALKDGAGHRPRKLARLLTALIRASPETGEEACSAV